MILYRKTILLLTFTLFMCLGWSATCIDGISYCQACCYKEAIPDIAASEIACTANPSPDCVVWVWEDRCEQMSDMNGMICKQKHRHSQSNGCPCNSAGALQLNDKALRVDGTVDWYSQGTNSQNGCGCQTGGNNPENYDRSCCAVGTGYHEGILDSDYECNGFGNTPIDCNTGNCEDIYDNGYVAGLEEGILIGAQSGDVSGDGELNVLDMVIYIETILNP